MESGFNKKLQTKDSSNYQEMEMGRNTYKWVK